MSINVLFWLVLNVYLFFTLIQKVPVTTKVLIISFVPYLELSAFSDAVTYELNLFKYNVHYKTG